MSADLAAGRPADRPADRPAQEQDEQAHGGGHRSVPASAAFEALLLYLKEARGFDFSGYKRTGLLRRVDKRMSDIGVSSYEDYLDYLQVHPHEFTELFNTILINVTDFFRDPEMWEQLRREVVPSLLARHPHGPLRLWSAGCASGQEACSLAIVFAEALGLPAFRERVKIYATDVDEHALQQARLAIYTDRELNGLTPEQVATYFEPAAGGYLFAKDLRRSIIYGRNDLVQDAPISRVDLVTCRNTLMYFNGETQGKIVRRLHFALKPHGILVLGRAETLLGQAALFEAMDDRRRFFRKVSVEVPVPSGTPREADARGQQHLSSSRALTFAAWNTGPVAEVVLDERWRLSLANARAEALFGLSAARDLGRPFSDLEMSFRPVELRSRIEGAVQERRTVTLDGIEWRRSPSERLTFDVHIVPLPSDGGALVGVAIYFADVTRYQQLRDELEVANRQLETAYEELQSANEELETTNEELQSTVEELETTNEELQSSNEELETMNEELQSMNDELQTTNEDLRARTNEVSELNLFSEAVLASLGAGVIVIDRDLRVRVVNRRAEDLWGLRQDESVGEHLLSLDIGLPLDRLKPLVRAILAGDGATAASGAVPPRADHIVLDAVNRRGRPLVVRVTVNPLLDAGDQVTGAIVVTDPRQDEDAETRTTAAAR